MTSQCALSQQEKVSPAAIAALYEEEFKRDMLALKVRSWLPHVGRVRARTFIITVS